MKLPQVCIEALLGADAKALATYTTQAGVHVVPVSTVRVENEGEQIIFVNYFLGQTLKNIEESPEVSLAFWKGLNGYQVKAAAHHETEGVLFDSVVLWVREILPDRVVKGVLVLTPTSISDISAGPNAGMKITV